jgi:ubiquinone/menaquinone biosynthesis C-methylase UbiE
MLPGNMGIYAKYLLPRLTHLAMGQEQLRPYRSRVVGGAKGRVLEIGMGSGRNLPFYSEDVEQVIGLDVSPEMLAFAERAVTSQPRRNITLLAHSAESLPFEKNTFDTVVITWTLCSIPNPRAALSEVRRVLKPDGELRFVEHGLAPEPDVRKWQDRLTPLWCRCAGGCHLNRKTDELIHDAGFPITELSTGYARGLRPMAYMYEGVARL